MSLHRELYSFVLVIASCLCSLTHGYSGSKSNSADYYTSQHDLGKLAQAEYEVANAVSSYITVLERRLKLAKRFLADYETSGISFNNSSETPSSVSSYKDISKPGDVIAMQDNNMASLVTAHPLRAYRLLRRYVKDLPSLEKELRMDEERKFLKVMEKVKTKISFPTQRDIDGATEGILRAHDTYNMDIKDFTSGRFYGLATNASMNAADCLFIGLYSLNATILTRAIEWLERAYQLVTIHNDKSVLKTEVKEKLEEAISKHNDALRTRSKNPYLFTEPVNLEKSLNGITVPRRRLLDSEHHVLQNRHSSLTDLTNFAALCRGKQLRNDREVSKLKCWHENQQPLNILNPLKIERHNVQPPVLQIYDLLTDKTMQRILDRASDKMVRSQVHAKTQPNNKMISSTRTSTTTWLQGETSSIRELTTVYKRLEEFTGLKILEKEASEDLQVSCYGIAGHFNPHLDTIFNSVDKGHLDKEEIRLGDRFATFMFYLSDVSRGGATAFSRIGVVAEPVKGSAIFWHNMNDQVEPDQLTLHGGCPILYGNKCVSNKWIRYNKQTSQSIPR